MWIIPSLIFVTPARLLRRYYFFFLHLSGAHRDLHSFPTRRSSDLRTHQTQEWKPCGEKHYSLVVGFCHTFVTPPRSPWYWAWLPCWWPPGGWGQGWKSTVNTR